MSETATRRFAPLSDSLSRRPAEAEAEVIELWRAEDVFRALERERAAAPPFVFWEGPPTANGRPGIHHILARTIKDSVCRFHTMLGKRVRRKAGWDTHGLPVELEVEKALGISGKPQIEEYGVAAFNAKCRESVWKYRKEWEELSARVGYWLDYSDPYVTYEPDYVESVWSLLKRFHHAGLVYRGKRVLPYCGRCGTGLSSHELGQPGVYRDVLDPSVTLRFRLLDRDEPGRAEPESLLAWTTTPWTLPSNFALAVHREREYVRVRIGGERPEIVWLAAARAAAVLKGCDVEVLDRQPGSRLEGRRYAPLFDARPPLVETGWVAAGEPFRVHHADFVTVEDGTGIVHQAPYGADDWALASAERMPIREAVGPQGRFVLSMAGVEEGTFFKDADDALMDDLKARGLLFRKARETHSYPHCWRCDTPLFYFPAPAWYIRTTAYKERMVELNRRITWVPPEVGEKRFGEWLANNVDWNISRDRYWGTPLPFWVCDGCEAVVAIGSVAELRERAGSLPEGFDNHKPLIDEVTFPCAACGGAMRRTSAVLDCWFDSGAMPYAQDHWPFGGSEALVRDQFPADFIAEGIDQTRGWFYTLHAIGAFLTDPRQGTGLPDGPAYRTCVVNGLVLDKDGVKMSKRLGNVVDPWQAIEEHGADAVRWYLLASGSPWQAKRFDPKGLSEVRRKLFGTLTNSYDFLALYARLDDGFDSDGPAPPVVERPEIDRWLASRTQTVLARYRAAMVDYDLAGACRQVERFVTDELSNWYIRRNRRRFWKGGNGADARAAFATLYDALRAVSLLIAPFAPFLADLLWRRLGGSGSVHLARLPEPDPALRDERLEESMRDVERIVEMGRALRERAGIKIRQPLAAIHVRSSDALALELLATPFATGLVLDELNVKAWGSLESGDGQLCSLRAKPNFRVLGKKVGPLMKAAAAAIGELGPEEVAQLRAGGSLWLTLDGQPVELASDDVEIVVQTAADFDVEADGRFVLFLDTELDEALLAEGLAREVVNRVNGLRTERGLAVEDRIRLRLDAGADRVLADALSRNRDLIAAETLAVAVEAGDTAFESGEMVRFELAPEHAVGIDLARG
jgi:isoleucyl-tRNA synthetase